MFCSRKRSSDGLARLSDIEHFYKKKRQTKEERLADVAAGREDSDYKFGRPKKNVSNFTVETVSIIIIDKEIQSTFCRDHTSAVPTSKTRRRRCLRWYVTRCAGRTVNDRSETSRSHFATILCVNPDVSHSKWWNSFFFLNLVLFFSLLLYFLFHSDLLLIF